MDFFLACLFLPGFLVALLFFFPFNVMCPFFGISSTLLCF